MQPKSHNYIALQYVGHLYIQAMIIPDEFIQVMTHTASDFDEILHGGILTRGMKTKILASYTSWFVTVL